MLDPKTVALVTPHDVAALQAILPLVTRHKTWLCERLGEDPAEVIANIAFELAYLHDMQNKQIAIAGELNEQTALHAPDLQTLRVKTTWANEIRCCEAYLRCGHHNRYCIHFK